MRLIFAIFFKKFYKILLKKLGLFDVFGRSEEWSGDCVATVPTSSALWPDSEIQASPEEVQEETTRRLPICLKSHVLSPI